MMQQQQPYFRSSGEQRYGGGYGGEGRASRGGSSSYGGGEGEEDGEGEEEEEEEEEEKAGRMLGFMFGNVDDTGDLDVEYLDQDAKEHLSALADQLGPSLVDLELSSKARQSASTAASVKELDDYDRKADDAVDYEDIDEACEDDGQMLPEDKQYYTQAALSLVSNSKQVEEDDNYDEEDEQVHVAIPEPDQPKPGQETPVAIASEELPQPAEVVLPSAAPFLSSSVAVSNADLPLVRAEVDFEVPPDDMLDESEDDFGSEEEVYLYEDLSADEESHKFDLPIIFQEHGKQILQFSEIFGAKQPFWMLGNKKIRTKRPLHKGRPGRFDANLDEDEAQALKVCAEEYDIAGNYPEAETRDSQETADRLNDEGSKFLSCQPLSKRLPELADLEGDFVANFDPVHQLNWETEILWDTERKLSQDEDYEVELAERDGLQASVSGQCSFDRPVLTEPLFRDVRRSKGVSRHPQMLRLEMWRHQPRNDLSRKLDKLNLEGDARNLELAGGAWLDEICWDDDGKHKPSKYRTIFDLTDNHMVFEVSDINVKETKLIRDHAAAMLISPRVLKGRQPEAADLMLPSRFNISNDKYYVAKKTTQQQKLQAKKRAIVGGVKVAHSVPALRLQTMKPKLTNKDLANFHRPKATWFPHHNEVAAKEQGELAVKGPMKVILKPLGGKGSRLQIDASDTLETFKLKAAKKFGDLKSSEKTKFIYSGRELETHKSFSEQKVPPNSVLHLVRTKVHPWSKAQRLPGENKPTRPPGAFKKKSELSVKDGHVALMEYCEERPLLLSNVGMGAVLSTYYRKMSPSDNSAATLKEERGAWIGAVLPLEPAEDSPFLGNVRLGETQSCLETNMYRAPVFQHRVSSTDFILVRSPKGKLSLRRIDSVHVVGQQEPHVEVIAPSSKLVLHYLGNRLLVHVYREFRAKDKPGTLPQIGADELMAHFPTLTDGFIRKRLKHCADLQRGPNGDMRWVMRQGYRIPSEEELRRMVTPENVCSYESMQAGQHHLKRMGVNKLTHHNGLGAAILQMPDVPVTLATAAHIERELQLTPWNLTANFVAAMMQGRNGIERLEIMGPGDPTGRGLGFSYIRAALRPPNTGAIVEKKAAAARGGGAVTGTDADLRRLSMEAAREVLLKFSVSQEEIDRLTRWDRIAMVRTLSSEHAAAGEATGAAALNKFARGNRLPFVQLQQQVRERCQEIWDRQVQSLLAIDGEESESDAEGNGDLDSFAGDLENLLEAEEEENKSVASKRDSKAKESLRGIGARRRAMQAQLEEDEDEAAEAAELHRMLMEDDEAEEDEKRKKAATPTATVNKDIPLSTPAPPQPVQALPTPVPGPPTAPSGKIKRKILKRIIKTKNPDGTITRKEEIIKDPIEIAKLLAKKNAANGQLKVSKVPVEKKKPTLKTVKKTPVTNKNFGPKSREAKEGLQVVCGGCGQLGHMRTNKKKCPLYLDEGKGEPEVIPDRPVQRVTIKKKKIEDLDGKPVVETPKLRVKFKSPAVEVGIQSAKSSSNSLPRPQEPKEKEPIVNGHKPMVVKIKLKKLEPEAEAVLQKPADSVEKDVEQPRLEVKKEEDLRQETQVKADIDNKDGGSDRKQPVALETTEHQMEAEKKRRADRIQDADRKKKKHKVKEHKKERQKEKTEDLERKLQEEKTRILQEMEAARLREAEERRLQEERARILREMQETQRQFQLEQQQKVRVMQPPQETRKTIIIKNPDRKNLKRREQFEYPEAPKRQRKRGGGEVELANILVEIVEQLKKAECAYLFRKPVTKKEAPDYHTVIKAPMDLSTMRDRARSLFYKCREDFLADMQQIVDNAHTYNEKRHPGIPPLADRLLEVCEDLLGDRHSELSEAEERMGDEDGGGHLTSGGGGGGGAGRKRSLRSL